MGHDLRYALRLLVRNPMFALTAIVSLAIGIGASTTVFSLASALLFRAPAGVADADRIVDVGRSQDGNGFDNNSYPNYLDVRERATVFSGLYAFRFDPQPMSLGGVGGAERIDGGIVTNNYFDVLGVRPAVGQFFSSLEGQPHVVLAHAFWTQHFHGDASIVGRSIDINGHAFTVIGVAPAGFQGTTLFAPDVWVPISMVEVATPRRSASILRDREAVWLLFGGRLKPGVQIAQAQAQLATIGAALEREYPRENRGRGLRVLATSPIPGNSAPVAMFMTALSAIVGLVLLIACANVAGMLLARAMSRRAEIAVRLSLGAARTRLVRQLLVETSMLFFAGAGLGLMLARVATKLLVALLPALPVKLGLAPSLDAKAFGFAIALSLVAAILSGLAPALHATRGDVVSSLKTGRQRLRNAFVVAQVALSIVLVVAAGLFLRALQRAASIDPGFDPRGVEIASLDLSLGGYTDTTGPVFARQLLERVCAIPGVQSATLSAQLPLSMGGMGLGGLALPGQATTIDADWNVVEPRYFETLRTPLLRGRDFTSADDARAPFVAIVNETLAQHFWPNADPIGKTLVQDGTRTLTIIGVARNAKYRTLGDGARNFIYVPLQQQYVPRTNIVARSTQGQRLAAELRATVASMNRNLPIVNAQSLEQFTSIGLVPQRIAASVTASLGIVGLLLAAIGIYGVTAYMVTSRTRELGIRMALGADESNVLRMVLRQGMRLVAIGLVIGWLLAAGASRLIASLLMGVAPLDAIAFGGAALVLLAIAAAACYVPARHAIAIEPAVALRAE